MNEIDLFDLAETLSREVYGSGFVMPELPEDKFSISRVLVDRVTDTVDEQHVVLNIFSVSGKGKSTCAVAIGEACANLLAQKSGKEPSYYFNINHISDGEPKRTRRIIYDCSKKVNPIVIIDEGARDSNSREGMKKENVENVKMNAVIRHKRMIIIRCVQFESFLDKGIRNQATHELTIVRAEHHKGYNECKFKQMVDAGSGTDDPWKVYPVSKDGLIKWHRVRIGLPTLDLLKEYRKLKDKSIDDFMQAFIDSVEISEGLKKKEPVETRRDITNRHAAAAWAYYMDESHEYVSVTKCATMYDLDVKTFRRWMARQEPPLDETMRGPV